MSIIGSDSPRMGASVVAPLVCGVSVEDYSGKAKIGDMTYGGGLAAAFDGNTNQGFNAGAKSSGDPGYVGVDLGVGNSAIPCKAKFYSSNDYGWTGGAGGNVNIQLFGSNSSPGNATDGTELGATGSSADQPNGSTGTRTLNEVDLITTTAYRYLWAAIIITGSDDVFMAEVQLNVMG